jgi:hypothetical protein
MGEKKQVQSWQAGDIFLVPLKDENAVVGQVLAHESEVLNGVSCAFFDIRLPASSSQVPMGTFTDPFSILFTTRDQLDAGKWRVLERRPVAVGRERFPYEHLRAARFVGAKVVGSRNIGLFVNAYYALAPWDDWADPNYLDRLLVAPNKKPARLLLKTGT